MYAVGLVLAADAHPGNASALKRAAELDMQTTLHEAWRTLPGMLSDQVVGRREDMEHTATGPLKACRAFVKRLASELAA